MVRSANYGTYYIAIPILSLGSRGGVGGGGRTSSSGFPDVAMTAYRVPPGGEAAVAPQFSPEALLDAEGRIFCVPEQVLGVPVDGGGPEFDRVVKRAARRLQLRHHPDRPGGSHFLSRCVATRCFPL